GTELPSTGGIGTTIFYIIGAILVIGAGIVLVARRRLRS
ncbi:LPXTG cell wall anchor domain-containing protein, partial [Streptococcus agalactiae]|nr:LPXTG cell wall anchor domain-containing protein [Streptococcus agalactiae]